MPKGQKRPPKRPKREGRVVRARYSPQLAAEICARLAAGELWHHIAGAGRMPHLGTLYAWRKKYPAFAEAIAQAREIAIEGGGPPTEIIDDIEGNPMDERPMARGPQGRRVTRDEDGNTVHVTYSEELSQAICERLMRGEHWSHFSSEPGMPAYSTFYRWQKEYPDFEDAVAEAVQIGAEARFEKALDVAMAATAASVQADKLKVATLLHHAERIAPHRYGSAARRGGGDGEDGRGVVQTFVIRHFEEVTLGDGTTKLIAHDSIQKVER